MQDAWLDEKLVVISVGLRWHPYAWKWSVLVHLNSQHVMLMIYANEIVNEYANTGKEIYYWSNK